VKSAETFGRKDYLTRITSLESIESCMRSHLPEQHLWI